MHQHILFERTINDGEHLSSQIWIDRSSVPRIVKTIGEKEDIFREIGLDVDQYGGEFLTWPEDLMTLCTVERYWGVSNHVYPVLLKEKITSYATETIGSIERPSEFRTFRPKF